MHMSQKRRAAVICCLGALSVISLFMGVAIGTVSFGAGDILKALFVDDSSSARLIIFNLRLPRVICGGLVGICLSLSGCMIQSIMRNTLASPSTIGVTSGAGFMGYLLLAAMPGMGHLLPIGTVLGAILTSLLIYALANGRSAGPLRIILSGMAVSALFGAASDMVKTLFPENLGSVSGFLVGGLSGTSWDTAAMLLPAALIGTASCFIFPRAMNISALGDETARSLGLDPQRLRLILIFISSLLAGCAVSAAGLIGFVGLAVPHMARLLVGADNRYVMPTSLLLGFSLVTLCDTLGRVIMPPGEIPVSIILALIGVPFFLWLLRAGAREGL